MVVDPSHCVLYNGSGRFLGTYDYDEVHRDSRYHNLINPIAKALHRAVHTPLPAETSALTGSRDFP
jgi:glutamine amidotransferase-like uncharacterized protein